MSLKTHLRLRRGTWFGRYQIGTGNMVEVDLKTDDKEQAQDRVTAIARSVYESANGRPFRGDIQVLPETEPSRYRHVATQPPVAAYQKNSEASYDSYARTAVARAGAQHQVDPKLAHAFFDANTNERIDSVDVGAPRQMSEGLKSALERVRNSISELSEDLRDELNAPSVADETILAFAALDEIETALSGQLVASFKWEPGQDPQVAHGAGAVSEPEVGHAVLGAPPTLGGTREDFCRPDDAEDENFITQGGGWATFKRNRVWWVERASDKCRVSFSLHTADDAVAGARFYEFREKHRSTALQFLLLTTVSERSAWVKK